MPNADPGELAVEYKAAPGISLERSLDIGRQITSEIRKNPAVQYTYTSLGSNGAKPFNEGQVYVHLIEREKRPISVPSWRTCVSACRAFKRFASG